jgi:hypothetical protein
MIIDQPSYGLSEETSISQEIISDSKITAMLPYVTLDLKK